MSEILNIASWVIFLGVLIYSTLKGGKAFKEVSLLNVELLRKVSESSRQLLELVSDALGEAREESGTEQQYRRRMTVDEALAESRLDRLGALEETLDLTPAENGYNYYVVDLRTTDIPIEDYDDVISRILNVLPDSSSTRLDTIPVTTELTVVASGSSLNDALKTTYLVLKAMFPDINWAWNS